MGTCATRSSGDGYGCGVLDGKNMARLVAGGVIAVAGLTESWDTVSKDADPGVTDKTLPHSLALVLVLMSSISMVVFALIMLLERSPLEYEDKDDALGKHWKREAADAQVYVTALALLSTAFYTGVSTSPFTTVDNVLQKPSGYMFLVAALLKVVEYLLCIIMLANSEDPDYEMIGQLKDASVQRQDARNHTSHDGFWNLVFSLVLVVVGRIVDCDPVKKTSVVDANATGVVDANATGVDAAKEHHLRGISEYSGCKSKDADEFVMISFVTLIVSLGCIFFFQALILPSVVSALGGGDKANLRAHIGLDGLAAVVAYTGLSTLAIEVGRGFYEQYYVETWLSANFLYYAALLFGFFGVIRLQGHSDAGEKVAFAGVRGQQGLVFVAVLVGIFSTAALWGADVLYTKLEQEAAEQLALETYAVVTLIVLVSHVVLTKIVETFVAPGFRLCGAFDEKEGMQEAGGATTTKRSEMTLGLALASAVFFAHKSWELSLSLLFVGTFAARFLGFYMTGKDEKDPTPSGRSLMSLFYEADTQEMQLGNNGVLFGSVSLVASFALWTVYVFRSSDGLVPKDSKMLVYWEAIAWFLLLAHVLLTLIGLIFPSSTFSAAKIPILRFGVSTYLIIIMSASVGIHGLESGLAPYAVPSLLTYITYDGISRARF